MRGFSSTALIFKDEQVFKCFSKVWCSPELERCRGNVPEKETTSSYLLLLDHSLFDPQLPVLLNGLLQVRPWNFT